ncbi:MAG: hypothetical protein AB7O64_17110 [Methylibium sp.]
MKGAFAEALCDREFNAFLIKRFIEDCAGVLRKRGDAKAAERFTKATTHGGALTRESRDFRWPSDRKCAAEPWPFLALNHLGLVTAEKRRRAKAVEAFWKR